LTTCHTLQRHTQLSNVSNVQFDEAEKVRMKKETLRLETKQTRQMTELKAKNEAIVKELDEVYVRYSTVGMHMFTAE